MSWNTVDEAKLNQAKSLNGALGGTLLIAAAVVAAMADGWPGWAVAAWFALAGAVGVRNA